MSEELNNAAAETAETEVNLADVFRVRREKLAALCAAGQDPFEKVKYDFDTYTADIHQNFDALENTEVRIAGRLMSRRDKN